MLSNFFEVFLLLYKHLDDFIDFSMNIEELSEFCVHLSDILKDDELLFISSILGSCLNDFKFEQKYIASRIVVFPILF